MMMANTKNEVNQRVASSFCGRYKDLHAFIPPGEAGLYTLVTSPKSFLDERATIFSYSLGILPFYGSSIRVSFIS
jgi:hypothetical protein